MAFVINLDFYVSKYKHISIHQLPWRTIAKIWDEGKLFLCDTTRSKCIAMVATDTFLEAQDFRIFEEIC